MLAASRVQGVLVGASGNSGVLKYIMNDVAVAPGEGVVTSGLDRVYPEGLPVGKVVGVTPGSIYKNIVVKPAVALDRLEEVLVVLRAPPEEHQASVSRPRP